MAFLGSSLKGQQTWRFWASRGSSTEVWWEWTFPRVFVLWPLGRCSIKAAGLQRGMNIRLLFLLNYRGPGFPRPYISNMLVKQHAHGNVLPRPRIREAASEFAEIGIWGWIQSRSALGDLPRGLGRDYLWWKLSPCQLGACDLAQQFAEPEVWEAIYPKSRRCQTSWEPQ